MGEGRWHRWRGEENTREEVKEEAEGVWRDGGGGSLPTRNRGKRFKRASLMFMEWGVMMRLDIVNLIHDIQLSEILAIRIKISIEILSV